VYLPELSALLKEILADMCCHRFLNSGLVYRFNLPQYLQNSFALKAIFITGVFRSELRLPSATEESDQR
jgi:hypothetical protein